MDSTLLFLVVLSVAVAFVGAASRHEDVLDDSMDVSEGIEKVNTGTRELLVHGDLIPSTSRNAVPCTSSGCKWGKSGRFVYVPITISNSYTVSQKNIIIRALLTFHKTTCVRFIWRKKRHRHYIYFYDGKGCFSSLGRQRRSQKISLKKDGCLSTGVVQHEVLHALGFHHEQVRSDRDKHVRILFENISKGFEKNFKKERTNNLGSHYDLNSIMQYHKYAFSKNGKPTILAKSDPTLNIGVSRAMTQSDIDRVNKLYKC
ncbi:unnamed protein product [Ophioblennius macclurei]